MSHKCRGTRVGQWDSIVAAKVLKNKEVRLIGTRLYAPRAFAGNLVCRAAGVARRRVVADDKDDPFAAQMAIDPAADERRFPPHYLRIVRADRVRDAVARLHDVVRFLVEPIRDDGGYRLVGVVRDEEILADGRVVAMTEFAAVRPFLSIARKAAVPFEFRELQRLSRLVVVGKDRFPFGFGEFALDGAFSRRCRGLWRLNFGDRGFLGRAPPLAGGRYRKYHCRRQEGKKNDN